MPESDESIEAAPQVEAERDLLTVLYDDLSSTWNDLKLQSGKLFVDRLEKIVIAEESKEYILIHRVRYNRDTDSYESFSNPTTNKFSRKIPVVEQKNIVLSVPGRYWINRLSQVKTVLVADFDIGVIEIGKFNRISLGPAKKFVKIPIQTFFAMVADINDVKRRGESYKSSIERHLFNKLVKKYRNRDIVHVTNTSKGEFNFLINRFNLPIKKKEAEFKKYLDGNDINAIQDLTKSLIVNNVFDDGFIRALDDYFIKDKLGEVVSLGRKILKFKGRKLNTRLAKELISKISPDKPISQLETLWQRFFEQNLLYLIFSYRQVFSKVGLEIEGSVKYPDFVGVNHYNGVDVIEIKTHLTPALVYDSSHKNFSFSADLSKAIIQTTNYMDAIRQDHFNEDEDREKIAKYTDETNLYRPRGIIVISSWDKVVKSAALKKKHQTLLKRDFTKLRNSLDSIEILTFDEVIDIADNYAKNIIKTRD